ncbi:MAG: pentapeptide repeat-containing protein [Candidatus Nanoarchaeia archaeon]
MTDLILMDGRDLVRLILSGERDFSGILLKNFNFNTGVSNDEYLEKYHTAQSKEQTRLKEYLNQCAENDEPLYFDGSEFEKVVAKELNFDGLGFQKGVFKESHFLNSSFKNSNFYGTNINHCWFRDCNFSDAKLNQSEIYDSDFSNSYFNSANLEGIKIIGNSYFCGANFSDTNLEGASIEANLGNAKFKWTNLRGVKGLDKCNQVEEAEFYKIKTDWRTKRVIKKVINRIEIFV